MAGDPSLNVNVRLTGAEKAQAAVDKLNQKAERLSATFRKMDDRLKAQGQMHDKVRLASQKHLEAIRKLTTQQDVATGSTRRLTVELGKADKAVQRKTLNVVRLVSAWLVMAQGYHFISGILRGITGIFLDIANTTGSVAEKINLATVAFKEQLPIIDKWAKQTKAALISTDAELKNQAGRFFMFVDDMGIARNAAVQMSMTLSDLTADLSSLFELPVDEVFTRLMSGLAGETESIRRFGVDTRVDQLEKTAKAIGLVSEKTKELSKGQQVLTIFYMLTQKLNEAQGDLERTQTSWSNAVKAFNTVITNTKTALGELLGVNSTWGEALSGVNGIIREIIQSMKDWQTENKALTSQLQGDMAVALAVTAQLAGDFALNVAAGLGYLERANLQSERQTGAYEITQEYAPRIAQAGAFSQERRDLKAERNEKIALFRAGIDAKVARIDARLEFLNNTQTRMDEQFDALQRRLSVPKWQGPEQPMAQRWQGPFQKGQGSWSGVPPIGGGFDGLDQVLQNIGYDPTAIKNMVLDPGSLDPDQLLTSKGPKTADPLTASQASVKVMVGVRNYWMRKLAEIAALEDSLAAATRRIGLGVKGFASDKAAMFPAARGAALDVTQSLMARALPFAGLMDSARGAAMGIGLSGKLLGARVAGANVPMGARLRDAFYDRNNQAGLLSAGLSGGVGGLLGAGGELAGNAIGGPLGGILGGALMGGLVRTFKGLFGGKGKDRGHTPSEPLYTKDVGLTDILSQLLNVTKLSQIRNGAGSINAAAGQIRSQQMAAGV